MSIELLASTPDLGLSAVFAIVLLACLAVPVPASLVALVAGGMSASGDLALTNVLVVCIIAFVIGDQIAFATGKLAGGSVLKVLYRSNLTRSLTEQAARLVGTHGVWAVLLSRTILSPTGPYVNYVCAISGLGWGRFSAASAVGAAVWSVTLASLGFVFAAQLPQLATLIGQVFAFAIGSTLLIGLVRLVSSKIRSSSRGIKTA